MFTVRSCTISFFLAILFFSSINPSLAQENASSSPALPPETQEYILVTITNLNKKIEAMANRLENIGGRIESRATLTENTGVDTSEAWPPLIQGVYLTKEIKSILSEIDALAKEMVLSSQPYGTYPGMLTNKYETIRTLLLESHSELLKALTVLKSLSATTTNNGNPVTTTSTTTAF